MVAITVLSTGNPLPMPIELDPPFDDYASNVYFEALEGMLVTVPDLKMVAGTNQYGEIAGVLEDLDIERVFQDDRAGTGELIFADDAGGVRLDVKTGDLVKGLYGPLDYTYDEYKVLPPYHAPQQPIVIRKGHDDPRIPRGRGRDGLSIATYNMYNLFDNINDTKKDDPIYSYWTMKRLLSKHANAIYNNLRLPDLIAVQEVEKLELLEALADTPPIPKDYYGAVLIDGPDTRGIDVGLLYRTDRVEILEYYARQTCTNLNDSYGPGVDPNYPCPPLTNPLFSRPPLVVHLKILDKNSDKWKGHHNHNDDDDRKPMDLWLIINHFKSKGVYPPYYADTTPRRLEQAAFVGSLVDEIQITDPDALVLVLGDLNDFENSAPLATLEARGLRNLIYEVEKEDRYTYIYRGVSEVLDHMLVTPSMEDAVDDVIVIHFNPDFPYAEYRYEWDTGIWSSDHDVLMVSIELDELDDDHDD
ncbi:MAG: endonuclease/exonuclease/phosphatase family protein [Candidatus Heimdallarchaeota archaeon]